MYKWLFAGFTVTAMCTLLRVTLLGATEHKSQRCSLKHAPALQKATRTRPALTTRQQCRYAY